MRPRDHVSVIQLDAATWCRHLVPKGSAYVFLAEHRHQLLLSGLLADAIRQGGGHRWVPARVGTTVMLLQAGGGPVGP